jgi:hypothetical protein
LHLNKERPAEKAVLIFSYPAVSRSYPLRFVPCLHCTPASMVAVRLPQPRHCAPRKIIISAIATIIIFCGAWGCLIAVFIRTPPKKAKQQHQSSQKKIKKESKGKFRFYKKYKFKPYGF